MQPAVKFVANFLEEGDLLKAHGGVEGDAGGLLGVDAGDDGVVAQGAGAIDQIGKEQAADAAAVVDGVDVDGIFDGAAIGGAGTFQNPR